MEKAGLIRMTLIITNSRKLYLVSVMIEKSIKIAHINHYIKMRIE